MRRTTNAVADLRRVRHTTLFAEGWQSIATETATKTTTTIIILLLLATTIATTALAATATTTTTTTLTRAQHNLSKLIAFQKGFCLTVLELPNATLIRRLMHNGNKHMLKPVCQMQTKTDKSPPPQNPCRNKQNGLICKWPNNGENRLQNTNSFIWFVGQGEDQHERRKLYVHIQRNQY